MSTDNLSHHPDDFFSYPTNRLTCYFNTTDDLHAAMLAFANAGLDTDDIYVLHGSKGLEILDIDGKQHGTLAQLTRLVQAAMSDTETHEMELMKTQLEAGHSVIAVPAITHERREQVRTIMHDNQGHHITFFARFYIENVEE